VYIISLRCDYNTRGQQLQSAFFLEWGYHSRRSPILVLTVPMLLYFCARNSGNRCFNIVRPLALEFGLLRMVIQPSADAHVIWVALHKVTRPQTILKFRPPSSLDYRTRHGSQRMRIKSACLKRVLHCKFSTSQETLWWDYFRIFSWLSKLAGNLKSDVFSVDLSKLRERGEEMDKKPPI
jgi:hypothetical protein